MRWDKLFADLESQIGEDALIERDALIDELREGEWASTTWSELCGGWVVLWVAGARVEGEVVSHNDQVLHLRGPGSDFVVSPGAVQEIVSTTRRADKVSAVTSRLGWSHLLRACRRDRDRIQIRRADGQLRAGTVDRVGKDFVALTDEAGHAVVIPFAAIAMLSCPR